MGSQASTEELVEQLVVAWSEALGVAVGPDSDFLALGGSSLAAVLIVEAIVARHPGHDGLDLFALDAVFGSPTLRQMAEELDRFMREPAAA